MNLSDQRIAQDIETIAGFNETTPDLGYSRPTFSTPWRQARDYLVAEAERAGCQVRVDAAGNVHARPRALPWTQRVWLSGSHLDSVPTGGKYDGVAGIVAALEVLRSVPSAPLELIIFAEEEGTTFNLGMLGSRAWAGTLSEAKLAGLRNRHGQSPLAAGQPHGVDPTRLEADRLDPQDYFGFIELHVEQGPAMWKAGQRVAVVTAINGRLQYAVRVTGIPNHAGSTKMTDRSDALVAAAEMVLAVERVARELDREEAHTVATVGRLNVLPNGINVIPGEVAFTIDLRARSEAILKRGHARLAELLPTFAPARHVTFICEQTESLPPVPMDAGLCARLRDAAARCGVPAIPDAISGALHDAAILASLMPTAMLFVPSRDGISHNPAEFSRVEDIAVGAGVLAACVTGATP